MKESKNSPVLDKKVVYKSESITIKKFDTISTSIYSGKFTKGDRVATVYVLPVRAGKDGRMEILCNVEYVPCWAEKEDQRFITCVSGGIKKDENVAEAASRELLEETGYRAKIDEFSFLGSSYLLKWSEDVVYCMLVDLTNKEPEEVDPQDNIEKLTKVEWKPIPYVMKNSVDLVFRNMAIEFMYTLLIRDAREVKKESRKQEIENVKPNRRARRGAQKDMEKEGRKRATNKSKNGK